MAANANEQNDLDAAEGLADLNRIALQDLPINREDEEMEGMLKEWLDTGEVSDKKEEPKVEVKETTTATSPASNVKEAFDDLFNE